MSKRDGVFEALSDEEFAEFEESYHEWLMEHETDLEDDDIDLQELQYLCEEIENSHGKRYFEGYMQDGTYGSIYRTYDKYDSYYQILSDLDDYQRLYPMSGQEDLCARFVDALSENLARYDAVFHADKYEAASRSSGLPEGELFSRQKEYFRSILVQKDESRVVSEIADRMCDDEMKKVFSDAYETSVEESAVIKESLLFENERILQEENIDVRDGIPAYVEERLHKVDLTEEEKKVLQAKRSPFAGKWDEDLSSRDNFSDDYDNV